MLMSALKLKKWLRYLKKLNILDSKIITYVDFESILVPQYNKKLNTDES